MVSQNIKKAFSILVLEFKLESILKVVIFKIQKNKNRSTLMAALVDPMVALDDPFAALVDPMAGNSSGWVISRV